MAALPISLVPVFNGKISQSWLLTGNEQMEKIRNEFLVICLIYDIQ
jgi:hypothetical protein